MARAVRAANVPSALRALVRAFGHLRVDVAVDSDAEAYPAVISLLKLAQLEPAHLDVHLEKRAGFTGISFVVGGESHALEHTDLQRDLESALSRALEVSIAPSALVTAGIRLAEELAAADAGRAAASAMLAAGSFEGALAALTAGVVSSHSGLGFHRAVVLAYDRAKGILLGNGGAGGDASFIARCKALEVALVDDRDDEVSLALGGAAPHVKVDGTVRSRGLAHLRPMPEFILARVAVRNEKLGLVFADTLSTDPIDEDRVRAFEAYLAHVALAWQTLRLRREIDELARYDQLTGLATRRELETRLTHERSRARRTREPLSLLVLEIDGLRDDNAPMTTKGVAPLRQTPGSVAILAGARDGADALLRRVAGFLREELRAHDMGARFDGDQLAVLLPAAGAFEAASVAKRLGDVAYRRNVSLSIGAASFPDDTDHPDDLVALASKNLQAAISAGGCRATLSEGGEPILFEDA